MMRRKLWLQVSFYLGVSNEEILVQRMEMNSHNTVVYCRLLWLSVFPIVRFERRSIHPIDFIRSTSKTYGTQYQMDPSIKRVLRML
jgi:hypothetical protein